MPLPYLPGHIQVTTCVGRRRAVAQVPSSTPCVPIVEDAVNAVGVTFESDGAHYWHHPPGLGAIRSDSVEVPVPLVEALGKKVFLHLPSYNNNEGVKVTAETVQEVLARADATLEAGLLELQQAKAAQGGST